MLFGDPFQQRESRTRLRSRQTATWRSIRNKALIAGLPPEPASDVLQERIPAKAGRNQGYIVPVPVPERQLPRPRRPLLGQGRLRRRLRRAGLPDLQ